MIFVLTFVAAFVINVLGFAVAYSRTSDKLTDFAYGVSFVTIAIVAYAAGSHELIATILLTLIILWAARLSSYLVIRILATKKDKRFDGIRENFWKFASFWLIQAVSSWIIMIAAIYLLSSSTPQASILTWIGLAVWVSGFVFESLADYQKQQFKKHTKNEDKWIEEGLWAHSRHPNYFGEITMWVGIYIYAFASLAGSARIIALISPIWIAVIIIFFSGIPKLEQYADSKWGDNSEYKKYKKSVPILIPKL